MTLPRFPLLVPLLLLFPIAGCGSDDGGGPSAPQIGYQWRSLGPTGGFVSSVAFDPANPGRIWASGDDSSGLFLSNDAGTTWSLQSQVPPNQSTYSLTIDPTDSQMIYAPNHFGRGFLRSNDGGASWAVGGTGLPTVPDQGRFEAMAIDASDSATLFACTASGLFRSLDFGQSFSPVVSPTFGADTHFTAAASSAAGVFVGSDTGRVYRSTDSGAVWTEVTAGASLRVTDLAVTTGALYIALVDSTLMKTETFTSAGLVTINTGGGGDDIDTGLWAKVRAVSGATAAQDTLYVGTVAKESSALWGFHASFDGGATFERRVNGLNGASAFSMAVDPSDSMKVVLGTVGQGIYRSSDGGLNWVESNERVLATAPIAVGIDSTDAAHMIVSSAEGLNATPGVFETFDGGTTWSSVGAVPVDALSLHIVRGNPSALLAGSFNSSGSSNPGIHRSVAGSGGPWAAALAARVRVERFVHTPSALFALATNFAAPSTVADLGIYASVDSGGTWGLRFNQLVTNVEEHPTEVGHCVAAGGDVWATTDSFLSAPTSLGLSAFAPGETFTSAVFTSPTQLLVGTATGRLFRTTSYDQSGVGVTWVEVASPVSDVGIRDIELFQSLYMSCFAGDVDYTSNSTPGVYRSDDGGDTWTALDEGMGASRLVYSLQPCPSGAARFVASMWGGGVLALDVFHPID